MVRGSLCGAGGVLSTMICGRQLFYMGLLASFHIYSSYHVFLKFSKFNSYKYVGLIRHIECQKIQHLTELMTII